MKRRLICLLLGAAALGVSAPVEAAPAALADASQSDNVQALQHIPMWLANEIAFDGRRVYVNQYASGDDIGVHSFDLTRDGTLKRTGMLHCDGITDTAPLDEGLVAIGLQQRGTRCNGPTPMVVGTSGGVQIGDMSDPARPRLLGDLAVPGGVHTLTRYPGSNFVYTAMGGADTFVAEGGITHIIDTSKRRTPKVAAVYQSPLNPGGCHDILFERIGRKIIGFCPGLGGTEIWDASDPLAPTPIGRMLLPATQLPHQVAVSSDGKVAAISDEAYAVHACRGGAPLGALWFYDISDLSEPRLLGFYGPQRGLLPIGSLSGQSISCTAHNFNFIPESRLIVVSWIGGGTNVIDISDPTNVEEVAHYRPDDAVAMSSYWYRGRIYVADFERGVEVLRLKL
ncbi:MAG: hypothetical protein M3N53_11780 [Actinomycetota bacterium]|nr:hypothetical protein [Actinomycetota bacterium]